MLEKNILRIMHYCHSIYLDEALLLQEKIKLEDYNFISTWRYQ